MPNQRELAKYLGLSQSTVSFALRGSPLIARETRKRVEEAARKIGYHPNPMVASLMEHIRSGRKIKDQGCLAILVDFENEEEWLSFHPAYCQQYEAIKRQAALRGYRTECFFLRTRGMSPEKIDRILYSRGIVGLILAGPRKDSQTKIEMKWERYACVKSGYTWEHPHVDCVSAHNRQHVELAFRELTRLGCKRIGYCIAKRMIPRADSNWVAGYLISQRTLLASQKVPMFITKPNSQSFTHFKKWIHKWKPDAVIGGFTEWQWLKELKQRKYHPRFCFRFNHSEIEEDSIEENDPIIGETLCDLVIEKMIHNKLGIPDHARLILIEGSWREQRTS